MGFDENAVGPGSHPRAGDGLNQPGLSAGNACRLVGLLKRMGDIEYYRASGFLHLRNTPEIHNQILVPKHGSPFRQDNPVVTAFPDFVDGKPHGRRGYKLSLLDINNPARLSGSHQDVGLAAQKGGYLEYVHIFCSHAGLSCRMNIGDHRNPKGPAYLCQNLQGLFVTNAGEGVQPRAVGFPVRSLEDVRDLQMVSNPANLSCNFQRHALPFDSAGTSHQQEISGTGMLQFIYRW